MAPNYQILYAVQPSAPYAATLFAPSISLVLIRPRFPETALVLPRDFRTASDPNLQPFAFRSPMSPSHRLLNAAQPSAPLCRPAISSPMPPQCPRRSSPLLYSGLAFPKWLWCFREISDCFGPYSTLTSASEATLNVLYIHY